MASAPKFLSLSLLLFLRLHVSFSLLRFPCTHPHNIHPFCNTSLPTSTRAYSLLSLLSLSDKLLFLSNNFSGVPRLGIPRYQWWSESLHGVATNGPGVSFNGVIKAATMYPQVITAAAAFNRGLWGEIAAKIAVEGRAMYNNGQAGLTFWAPNINIFRDPRWGRGQETPGEDPLVVSEFGVEYVRGFQWGGDWGLKIENLGEFGERRVLMEEKDEDDGLMLSACCKHFTAYDLDKWGDYSRYSFNAVVTEQDMEDSFQPPFKSCIQQGKASCLMCSYNSVNGVPACARGDLLHKVRTQWGFHGYITSDCDAVATIYEYHHYTSTKEDAVADALKAGVDINCGTYLLRNTKAAIEQGKVHEEDIDRALINLFMIQLRLGLFDGNPLEGKFGRLGAQDVCTNEHRRLALEGARQGIVLLKNEKEFLPLNKNNVSSLVVVGPGANDASQLLGGYSGVPCDPITYFKGLKTYIKETTYVPGCINVSCDSNSSFHEAIQLAKEAEYVIVVVGLDLSQETEDKDRVSLLLPGEQMALVSSIADVSKRPLVLVLTGGGPLDVSFAKDDPRIASTLWVGYPGEAGGRALAEIVFGDHSPGGRLPLTWYPESFAQIPMNDMNMRTDPSRGYPGRTYRFYTGKTVYDFGHGLSYSSYRYKLLTTPRRLSLLGSMSQGSNNIPHQTRDGLNYVIVDELSSCKLLKFKLEISVMNVGSRDGRHVMMLFSRPSVGFEGSPRKQLIGYTSVHIAAKGMVVTRIEVDPCERLSFANEEGKRVLVLGEHVITVGDLEHSLHIET